MPSLQELSNHQINEAIAIAVERQIPVTVSVLDGRNWMAMPARALCIRDMHLLIELSCEQEGGRSHSFSPADKVGISFKLKHHKHIFTSTVAGVQEPPGEFAAKGRVLCLCRPTKMHRIQRRAFSRAEVPPNRIVRASFWIGGKDDEPAGGDAATPVWSGCVKNISAGGFQAHVDQAAASALEIGDVVGVRIVFGVADQAIRADAQVRHIEPSGADPKRNTSRLGTPGTKAMIGFRFIGLDHTPEGRATMQAIAYKVGEYERIAAAAETRLKIASAPFRLPANQPEQTTAIKTTHNDDDADEPAIPT